MSDPDFIIDATADSIVIDATGDPAIVIDTGGDTGILLDTTATGADEPAIVIAMDSAGAIPLAGSVVGDINVTGTINPSNPTVLTLSWVGTLALARGGTGVDLSATGGAHQVLRQSTAGGAVTVSQLSVSDLTAISACSLVGNVFSAPFNPTIFTLNALPVKSAPISGDLLFLGDTSTTPATLSTTTRDNLFGTLSASAISSGTLPAARLPAPTLSALGGIQAINAVSHQWIASIDTTGVAHLSQPSFADLSGNIATSQMNSGTGASSSTFWRGDGTWATVPAGGGNPINAFRNASMDVWQRGTSGTATTVAGPSTQGAADGWYVVPTGANVTWAQVAGRSLSKWSLKVTGNTSVTDVLVKQRVHSADAAKFTSQRCTIQAQIFNSTGSSITPTLTVKHANSVDNWSASTTDVSAVSLQACANGAWTQVAYTFDVTASAANGLEVTIDFGNNFSANTKNIQVTECSFNITTGVSTGLNGSPPAIQQVSYADEFIRCLRFLWSTYGDGVSPGTATSVGMVSAATAFNSAAYGVAIQFPIPMVSAPSISYWDSAGTASQTSQYFGGAQHNSQGAITSLFVGVNSFQFSCSTDGTTSLHILASAEL